MGTSGFKRLCRHGNVMVLLALMLPACIGIAAICIDGNDLISSQRELQQAADASALAAATEWMRGGGVAEVIAEGQRFARRYSDSSGLSVEVTVPPTRGRFAGRAEHVGVTLRQSRRGFFSPLVSGSRHNDILVHSTAGLQRQGRPVAMIALDPSPKLLSVAGLPLTVGTSASLAGIESTGLAGAMVHGAIHVNNEFGGLDEHGHPVGNPHLLRHAAICLPGLLGLGQLRTDELRVVGGVDWPGNYSGIDGRSKILSANRLPVPDPYRGLPEPIAGVTPGTSSTYHGTCLLLGLPLISPILAPPVQLQPGVYDWIFAESRRVHFAPGVYIIRGHRPLTLTSLSLVDCEVRAHGVMFYIQNPVANSGDGFTEPPYTVGAVVPSVLIANLLARVEMSGLNAPGNPYNGVLLYQQRSDRRPIAIVAQNLLSTHDLSGVVYAKWAPLILAGQGRLGLTLATGSIRLVSIAQLVFDPTHPAPAAAEVALVD